MLWSPILGVPEAPLSNHRLNTSVIPSRQNILLDASGNIKLADFGLAIDLNDERAVTRAGTLDYMVGGRDVRDVWTSCMCGWEVWTSCVF